MVFQSSPEISDAPNVPARFVRTPENENILRAGEMFFVERVRDDFSESVLDSPVLENSAYIQVETARSVRGMHFPHGHTSEHFFAGIL